MYVCWECWRAEMKFKRAFFFDRLRFFNFFCLYSLMLTDDFLSWREVLYSDFNIYIMYQYGGPMHLPTYTHVCNFILPINTTVSY